AAGWHGPDVQPARRLHLARRRRRRALRLPHRRDHRGVRCGADGRPHPRISRQEDRGARDEVRHARGAALSVERSRIYGRVRTATDGARQPQQQRPARALRDRLSLRLEQRQQRLGFRRDQRQHALVQHDGRPRHAARPLRLCRASAGHGRLARGEEDCPGLGRHVPYRRPAVRRALGRRDRHPLPLAILPRPVSRAGGRAFLDARRQDLLTGVWSMSKKAKPQGLFDRKIIGPAAMAAVHKLDPRALAKNPVIFVTEVVSVLVTLFFVRDLIAQDGVASFTGQIAAWLWFTVLFANFAEAVAEGRGKAQADTLRRARTDTIAKRYVDPKRL